ncbi:GntR family transcriptional regulator [Kaistia defluvii]|uniref:GntR family transcriptional regulator n=1 Tax=Kaistia defluvii TaxID=410841 RepID=UPI00224F5306|nr:GntR family transcriptional regulator [Kaistia defluvii]MCX5520818.1 GntR family transcriptional regulator [Kaistia defluvii]
MSAMAEPEDMELPLYEVIYRVLRRHIVEARLPRGLVIGETALARAFQSSRIPAGAALRRLEDEGLVVRFGGRGLMIGEDAGAPPLRLDLIEAGLTLPDARMIEPRTRNRRATIYPEVEHIVACCLPYGRFHLNESLLADHYGVSRTVAHEVLTGLDRAGLVTQDKNQRWYAGPLTPELLHEHFELRWLLEPIALEQALPHLDPAELRARHERIRRVQAGKRTPARLEQLENDLHVETVLRCSNSQLRDAIRRSQLPLIAMHETFQRHRDTDEIEVMLGEHLEVFEHLLAGRTSEAQRALERHLRRSVISNRERLTQLDRQGRRHRVPFLIAVT